MTARQGAAWFRSRVSSGLFAALFRGKPSRADDQVVHFRHGHLGVRMATRPRQAHRATPQAKALWTGQARGHRKPLVVPGTV